MLHHHWSVTLTSARAILHHTDHTLGKHFAPECMYLKQAEHYLTNRTERRNVGKMQILLQVA